MKDDQSFLRHVSFYQRFIKYLSKITHPMCMLFEKEAKLDFDGECVRELNCLKMKLVWALIIIASNWSQPFELMCDASGLSLGVVLRKTKDKFFHPICYAIKILNYSQHNYMVMEQELLVGVYVFEKFHAYFWGYKSLCTSTMQLFGIDG